MIPSMKNTIESTVKAELDNIKKLPNSRKILPKKYCKVFFAINISVF